MGQSRCSPSLTSTEDFKIEENMYMGQSRCPVSFTHTEDLNVEENTWVNPIVLHPSPLQPISDMYNLYMYIWILGNI